MQLNHPNEEALEVDCFCQPPGSLHLQDCLALDTRGKAKEGSSEDHMVADGGERNATDGKYVEQHLNHG